MGVNERCKLNYKQIISDANERYSKIIRACVGDKDYDTIVSLVCSSLYSDQDSIPNDNMPEDNLEPVLKENFCFDYKGYKFELSSCTTLTNIEQVIGITKENFIQKFPNGVFTDRYVCWMWGRTDCVAYLIPGAWLWGASIDLKVGSKVDKQILANIDKFLETFEEEDLND